MILESNGTRLVGNDWFTAADKGDLRYAIKDDVKIHFHLHPDVLIKEEISEENAFILALSNSGQWKFSCKEAKPHLEESIFFSQLTGPGKTAQIIIAIKAGTTPEVNWVLEKV